MNISSDEDVRKGRNIQDDISEQLNLFKPMGVKNPEMWQCMKYVAPSNEKKNWKAKDVIATYCEVCKVEIPYNAQKNSKEVSRHITQKHPDLLEKSKKKSAKKRNETRGKIDDFFPKQVKKVKIATKGDQDYFTKRVPIWTAYSLRPFAIAKDEDPQSIINFATQVDGILKLPLRNTNKQHVDKLANKVQLKMRAVIAEKCCYFSSTSDLC